MKKILLILLILLPLTACNPSVNKVCRHYALDAALTWTDLMKEETRIIVGWSADDAQKLHAEAQALHEGEWVWIVNSGTRVGLAAVVNENSTAIRFKEVLLIGGNKMNKQMGNQNKRKPYNENGCTCPICSDLWDKHNVKEDRRVVTKSIKKEEK